MSSLHWRLYRVTWKSPHTLLLVSQQSAHHPPLPPLPPPPPLSLQTPSQGCLCTHVGLVEDRPLPILEGGLSAPFCTWGHHCYDALVCLCSQSSPSVSALLWEIVCWLLACLTSQQHVPQARICSDNCTCSDTEIEVADHTFYLTQSQLLTEGRPVPVLTLQWQAPAWAATGVPIFKSLAWLDTENVHGSRGNRSPNVPLSRRTS